MSGSKKPIVVICSSAAFYKRAVKLQEQLETWDFIVVVPTTATKMKKSDDYDVSHYKTWFSDANDYPKKANLMRGHFDEVATGDAILVVNEEKHGQPNYIGGNVLMEMALAFYLHKPIFILNEIPEDSPFVEEIKGFMPVVLHGKLNKLSVDAHDFSKP